MKKYTFIIVILIIISIFYSCTTSPEVYDYPERQIDRPPTVPKGVSAWHIPTFIGVWKIEGETAIIPPIPIPIGVEVGVTDNFALYNIFGFLPIMMSYTPYRTSLNYITLSGPIGGLLFYIDGVYINPTLDCTFGVVLSDNIKLTTGIQYSSAFRVSPEFQFIPFSNVNNRTSIGYQIADKTYLSFALNTYFYNTNYFNVENGFKLGNINEYGFSMEPVLRLSQSFNHEWDMELSTSINTTSDMYAIILDFVRYY